MAEIAYIDESYDEEFFAMSALAFASAAAARV